MCSTATAMLAIRQWPHITVNKYICGNYYIRRCWALVRPPECVCVCFSHLYTNYISFACSLLMLSIYSLLCMFKSMFRSILFRTLYRIGALFSATIRNWMKTSTLTELCLFGGFAAHFVVYTQFHRRKILPHVKNFLFFSHLCEIQSNPNDIR